MDKLKIIKGQHHIITKPILKKSKNAEVEIEKKKEFLDVIKVLSDGDEEDDEEIEQA